MECADIGPVRSVLSITWEADIPFQAAFEVDGPRVLWALNVSVSMFVCASCLQPSCHGTWLDVSVWLHCGHQQTICSISDRHRLLYVLSNARNSVRIFFHWIFWEAVQFQPVQFRLFWFLWGQALWTWFSGRRLSWKTMWVCPISRLCSPNIRPSTLSPSG